MKTARCLALLIFVVSALGQETPMASKIDEFGKITCEDLLARIDNFAVVLQNNPSATGIAVIDSPLSGHDRSPFYRLLIQKTFQRNRYAYDRLAFVRRKMPELGGSFWLVPAGADRPYPEASTWPDIQLDLSRAFVWDTYSDSDDGICPTFAPRVYAEIIKANAGLRGHIVVHTGSRCESRKLGRQWIAELVERYGVGRERLRYFVGSTDKSTGSTEFWLVATKKPVK